LITAARVDRGLSGREPTSPRRRWTAITVATLVMFSSYSLLLRSLIEDDAGESRTAAFGVGLAIVPFVFVALAFLSRHRNAPVAVLKSLGAWLVVTTSVGLIVIVLGLTVGFGVAGMLSLRADEAHSYRTRAVALVIATVYVLVLLVVAPPLGIFTAGVAPLIALGFADSYAEHRAAAAPG